MRLIALELKGFKRFAQARTNLDADVIAVVGPNEAGKTSLLMGMLELESTDPIQPGMTTRGLPTATDDIVIKARYLIEAEDHAAIDHIPEATSARWFTYQKAVGGARSYGIEPYPRRSSGARARLLRKVDRVLLTRWAKSAADSETKGDDDQTKEAATLGSLTVVATLLKSDDETLAESAVSTFQQAADAIDSLEGAPATVRSLSADLRKLANHESLKRPVEIAGAILTARRPRTLLFAEADRYLESTYEFSALDEAGVPAALENLFALGQIDGDALRNAVRTGQQPEIERLERDGNAALEAVFSSSWGQAKITVRLRVGDTAIHVLVSTIGGEYTSIAERSDGLRAFVALLAYIHRYGGDTKPVLLIDEAEIHLHYDAQADLVRVLERQDAAAQVIYTTHSAGCLPEDLGTGIRVVVREGDAERSTIRDAFWTEGAGFSPLVLSMGASALAFSTARRAVIAEGSSDMVLLPTLFREATQLPRLGFQVAPGLAEATPEIIPQLDLEAGAVAYVLDNDPSGRKIAARLRLAGIPGSRIFTLGGGQDVVLEDLLTVDAYADAVNEELRRSGRDFSISVAELKGSNRPGKVAQRCKREGVSVPSKVAIAYRLLDANRTTPRLLSPNGRRILKALYGRLSTALRLPPQET